MNEHKINKDTINDASYMLAQILCMKNADYGGSFESQYNEYGLASVCMRIEDKLKRLKNINKNGDILVFDERIQDTLLDLAGYSLLAHILESQKMSEKEIALDEVL